jgi:hypothetical protein
MTILKESFLIRLIDSPDRNDRADVTPAACKPDDFGSGCNHFFAYLVLRVQQQ